jgi:hypothetical protein
MYIIVKIALVMLAGIYAMRTSNALFHPAALSPMWFVAAFAFVMSLVLFHRPPIVQGWWQYSVIGLCAFGVVANGILFFAPDAAHSDPINLAFSAASIIGWALVAASSLLLTFAPPASAA